MILAVMSLLNHFSNLKPAMFVGDKHFKCRGNKVPLMRKVAFFDSPTTLTSFISTTNWYRPFNSVHLNISSGRGRPRTEFTKPQGAPKTSTGLPDSYDTSLLRTATNFVEIILTLPAYKLSLESDVWGAFSGRTVNELSSSHSAC